MWAHSSLFSHAVQDGELLTVDCPVLCADRHFVWYVEDPTPPADGPWMFPRPVQKMHSWGTEGLGQNAAMGPPDRPKTGSRGPSTPHGWWVSWLFIFFGCGSLFLIPFFYYFYRGIQGVRFSTNSAVACPPMSLPSTCQTQLGRAVLGSKLFVLIFFVC